MTRIRDILHAFFDKLFAPLSIEVSMQQERDKAELLVRACDKVILSHRFQRHMAQATLNALREWQDSGRLRDEEEARDLLEQVRLCYTRDDDLPGDLLPRIDKFLDGLPRQEVRLEGIHEIKLEGLR